MFLFHGGFCTSSAKYIYILISTFSAVHPSANPNNVQTIFLLLSKSTPRRRWWHITKKNFQASRKPTWKYFDTFFVLFFSPLTLSSDIFRPPEPEEEKASSKKTGIVIFSHPQVCFSPPICVCVTFTGQSSRFWCQTAEALMSLFCTLLTHVMRATQTSRSHCKWWALRHFMRQGGKAKKDFVQIVNTKWWKYCGLYQHFSAGILTLELCLISVPN